MLGEFLRGLTRLLGHFAAGRLKVHVDSDVPQNQDVHACDTVDEAVESVGRIQVADHGRVLGDTGQPQVRDVCVRQMGEVFFVQRPAFGEDSTARIGEYLRCRGEPTAQWVREHGRRRRPRINSLKT